MDSIVDFKRKPYTTRLMPWDFNTKKKKKSSKEITDPKFSPISWLQSESENDPYKHKEDIFTTSKVSSLKIPPGGSTAARISAASRDWASRGAGAPQGRRPPATSRRRKSIAASPADGDRTVSASSPLRAGEGNRHDPTRHRHASPERSGGVALEIPEPRLRVRVRVRVRGRGRKIVVSPSCCFRGRS